MGVTVPSGTTVGLGATEGVAVTLGVAVGDVVGVASTTCGVLGAKNMKLPRIAPPIRSIGMTTFRKRIN